MLSHFAPNPLDFLPLSFKALKNPPKLLHYVGELKHLQAPLKVAIVGTRRPSTYTQQMTSALAKELSKTGAVVISGGALGVDIIAQKNALPATIMCAPCSLERIYPPSNAEVICQIAKEGLILSEYAKDFQPYRFTFLERNRLVVALSDLVVIPEAQENSGSMASAKLALELKKPLFVLPQRLFESPGTNALLAHNQARAIYDIAVFVGDLARQFGLSTPTPPPTKPADDEFLAFCQKSPSFEEAYAVFGDLVLEQELLGVVKRENGRVVLV
ncbi:DNA-processing protein DprA [Helicobacter heilmannii]|uniref:DNA-processing protein DprA n=1 Tax=Helicobacter heilmannii TaxID=35817 RepID=UPI0006A028E5|nr:DNA-processing protein DprA [Helicobacter heilmannii]CRF45911.1 Rossmann fold nucleotide-binding protein Smf possibly involved in DNA uptake [Helicobacter heilmannii]CRF49519.1 Rossmann fold nucleotide-binding protein Smf possibly involved in DNA uptake [Helicobacter heilmannii]CRF50956.1 Rossmann fold nucleotide-binding protein Smf possibly involved in DNA uptake [Helicobacter heilmannii]